MEFLKLLHSIDNGIAYVDIKPEDVLIKQEEMNEINYSNVLFFDLDAALEFGDYDTDNISITEAYKPAYFSTEGKIEIGTPSENCTYAKGIRIMASEKLDGEDGEVEVKSDFGDVKTTKEILNTFLKGDSLDDEIACVEEDDVMDRFSEIKEAIDENEKLNCKTKDLPRYNRLVKVAIFILPVLYALFGISSYNILNNANFILWSGCNNLFFVSIMCVLIIVDTISILYFAQKYSHIKVGTYYYDALDSKKRRIRNSDYNIFRQGTTRKKTTFKDDSVLHKAQQGARHIWWIVLALGICVGCVWISFSLKALPLFVVFTIKRF